MSEQRIIIRKQSAPTRCEICHQTDQFDPETYRCRRCAHIPLPLYNSKAMTRSSSYVVVASVLTFLAIFVGPCLGPLGATLGLVGAVLGKLELDMIKGDAYLVSKQKIISWARFAFYGGIVAVVFDMLVFVLILLRND